MGKPSAGFSLIEALVALGLGTLFLTGVISTWYFSNRIWREEGVRSRLRYYIEKSMEKMKEDVRLSDSNGILFYPSTAATFTAFSLPAATRNANGFFTIASGITWDRTVIYHFYDNTGTGKQELRRTVFNSFNSSVSTRQTQLDTVAAAGTAANASTTTLFSTDSVNLEISSTSPRFDAYASSTSRSATTSFGSVRLSAGNHQIRFEVTGKNASSIGYGMGFDSIALSPSGGIQEAEELTVSADSGKTKATEDMSGYGNWGGNYQKEYQSSAVGDHITFQTYYDQWLESNFEDMTFSYLDVVGTNPRLTVQSREEQSLAPSWQAGIQTLASAATERNVDHTTVRSIISGAYVFKPGQMVRIKFTAPTSGQLTISSAYFGVRSGATSSFTSAPLPLYFSNPTVPEGGSDGTGAVGSGPTAIAVPAGHYVWSNWFEYDVPASSVPDYLVSYYTHATSSANVAVWDPGAAAVNSYTTDDDHAADISYASFAADQSALGTAEMATWLSSGTATSQVYDTKITSPSFNELSWTTPSLPAGAAASLKVRTSANADMSGASAWSSLPSHSGSPTSLSGLANTRYIQFQVALQAASPYTDLPEVDNVKIDWPGQTAFVEIVGSYTKRSNYGIFKVLVDGLPTTNALGIKLTANEVFRGATFSGSLNANVRPRNTGK